MMMNMVVNNYLHVYVISRERTHTQTWNELDVRVRSQATPSNEQRPVSACLSAGRWFAT